MSAPQFHDTANTLCGPHTVTDVDTPFDEDAWYVVPEHLSIFGTDLFTSLDRPTLRRLGRTEAALLASNTVHGEDQVLGGLEARAGDHHFVEVFAEEERNHQRMFRAYLAHLGLELLPTRAVGWMTPPLTEPEFYACTYVFEDVVGRTNRAIARDERLHPVARAVNQAHAVEEAVHLNFGRSNLARILPHLDDAARTRLAGQVGAYLRAVWRERYRSDVYELAGLPEPWLVARLAWDAPAQVAHRIEYTAHALRELDELGLDPEGIAA